MVRTTLSFFILFNFPWDGPQARKGEKGKKKESMYGQQALKRLEEKGKKKKREGGRAVQRCPFPIHCSRQGEKKGRNIFY